MPDETPNPLLVVRCGINLDRTNDPWVAPDDPDPTLPALAVPDALWTDRALAWAVWSRLQRYDTAVVQDVLTALGVELKARVNFHHETTP